MAAKSSTETKKKTTRSAGRGKDKKVFTTANIKFGVTIVLSGIIPLFTMACSLFSGYLRNNSQPELATFAVSLALVVLMVSTPHLAGSLARLTKSGWFSSYALAVAIDGGILLGEMVFSLEKAPVVVATAAFAMMGILTLLSGFLNWYAFTNDVSMKKKPALVTWLAERWGSKKK